MTIATFIAGFIVGIFIGAGGLGLYALSISEPVEDGTDVGG